MNELEVVEDPEGEAQAKYHYNRDEDTYSAAEVRCAGPVMHYAFLSHQAMC